VANSLQLDITANHGFVDAQCANTTRQGGRITTTLVEDDSYGNMNDLDTRLQALDAGTYTQAYLRTLNKNDKTYALRLNRESNTI